MRARLVATAAVVILCAVWVASTGTAGARQRGSRDARTPSVSGPVTGGYGTSLLGPDVSGAGYVREEFFIEGEAAAFEPIGALTADGKWRVSESETAPFKTRIVMWKPADPAEFNGTAFVEWLNVSPGFDNPPDWLNAHNYFVREGAVWIGVSAQAASVHGGANVLQAEGAPPPGGLRTADPERYGTLHHPGDAFSYDVFTQVGVAVRGDGDGANPLDGYNVERVIALGESQSAFRLTTYVNGVHRLARVYDGFFIHSRSGQPAPLGDQVLGQDDPDVPNNVKVRRDIDVPVLTFETEGDLLLLRFTPARQRDSRNFRLWEVAGTAHADAYLAGPSLTDLGDGSAEAALLDPGQASTGLLNCAEPVNAHGQFAVVMAALASLDEWVRTGAPSPKARRIKTTGSAEDTTIVRDEHGIARGGIRTPIIDVPLAANDGEENAGAAFCRLFGHTKPFDAATLAELYPNGEDDYVEAFERTVDEAVEQGYWLKPEAENFKAAARQLEFG